MKIFQLIFTLSSGGAEKFVVNLSNELARRGHDVTVVTIRHDTTERYSFNKKFLSPNVKYHSMGFGQGFTLSMVRKVGKFIKEEKPDIVHCHLLSILYLATRFLSGSRNVVHTIHSVAEKTVRNKFTKRLLKFLYRSGRVRPVTISIETEKSYRSFFSLDNSRMIINGCPQVMPSADYEEVVKEINEIRRNGEPVFIHVARFNKLKNQQLLVNAFNALCDEKIPFKLIVIGRDFDSPEAKPLVDSACQNIHFLGEKNNVGDYLLQSDAFCMTSNYEGMPISMLEAMSVGLTPISTPVGGVPDVITDGVTGYLSAGMSVDEYCVAVKRYISSPIDRELLKGYFSDNYSMPKCARQYEQLFDDIVRNKD